MKTKIYISLLTVITCIVLGIIHLCKFPDDINHWCFIDIVILVVFGISWYMFLSLRKQYKKIRKAEIAAAKERIFKRLKEIKRQNKK